VVEAATQAVGRRRTARVSDRAAATPAVSPGSDPRSGPSQPVPAPQPADTPSPAAAAASVGDGVDGAGVSTNGAIDHADAGEGASPVPRERPPRPARRLAPGLGGDGIRFPKSSAAGNECDDAWALDLTCGRAAVADGASSAYMSGEWAHLLVTAYVADPPAHELVGLRRWILECSQRWASTAAAEVPDEAGDWWTEASARRGSFATLLGVRVGTDEVSGDVCWDAVAVGDSCLVQVRPTDDSGPSQLVSAFPVDHSAAFGGSPELVPTADAEGAAPVEVLRTATGTLRPGDRLLLMTDALAQWALGQDEQGRPPWDELVDAAPDRLAALVGTARAEQGMVDDDVTLLRLSYSAEPEAAVAAGGEDPWSTVPVDRDLR
jgi:hypothetical protein